MADPENKTGVLRDFTFKQIFHVMIGGVFFDVMVPIPLTASTNSSWPLLIVCLLIMGVVVAAHPAASRECRGRLSGHKAAPAMTCHQANEARAQLVGADGARARKIVKDLDNKLTALSYI